MLQRPAPTTLRSHRPHPAAGAASRGAPERSCTDRQTEGTAMRFSLIYEAQTVDASRAGDHKVFDEIMEQVVLAEDMGFDVVWAVEHTALTNYAHMSAPETFLAFVAG